MITAIKDAQNEWDQEWNEWNEYYSDQGTDGREHEPMPSELLGILVSQKGQYSCLKNSPFRAVRMEDRIKKLLSIDKQCI